MESDTSENENEKYKIKVICDNVVYARESKSGHLPKLYYLVSYKKYLEEENTWKSTLAI